MEDKLIMNKHCEERFRNIKEAVDELIANSDKDVLVIGIDGKCASGKTTLGYYLNKLYDSNLFHMDDFFLQNHQRTEERLSEVGGNVDYERFKEEVLDNILEKKDVNYRPFSCMERKIKDGYIVSQKRINIIEGSYSLHPYFNNCYDLKIFTDISDEKQLENIEKRNGPKQLIKFRGEWIPKENAYFEKFNIKNSCITVAW